MSDKAAKRGRRNIFIKKRFQTGFAVKFLALIAVESLLAVGLFWYVSRGTVITGYSGSDVVVARTGEYLLPTLLLANLAVIGVTAIAGFIVLLYLSHRIAGPLYRFEKTLDEVGSGDLTRRFVLREDDQMHELAEKMNWLNEGLDWALSDIQQRAGELSEITERLKAGRGDTEKLALEAEEKLKELRETANHFRTSHGGEKTPR